MRAPLVIKLGASRYYFSTATRYEAHWARAPPDYDLHQTMGNFTGGDASVEIFSETSNSWRGAFRTSP